MVVVHAGEKEKAGRGVWGVVIVGCAFKWGVEGRPHGEGDTGEKP